MQRRHLIQWGAAALAASSLGAQAQSFPVKPIKLVIAFPAGGPTDITMRVLADNASKILGQPVVVENKPGAGGTLPAQALQGTSADGYTLAQIPLGVFRLPYTTKINWDPVKDISYVLNVTGYAFGVVVPADSPLKTWTHFVAWAKANPGKLSYGSAGVGSSNHLGALLFSKRSGIDMNHVPYKGNAPAMTDVMGGQINMMMDIISTASVYINSGKVRAIAVTSPQRNASLPNVPTFAESGIEGLKGFDVGGWYAVYGPKGMSADLQAKLNKAVNAALAQPELKAKYKELGYDEWTGSPEKLTERAAKERQMWSTVTQGIVVD